MIAQIIIKILGLIYKLYLTNKEGFGAYDHVTNCIYINSNTLDATLAKTTSASVLILSAETLIAPFPLLPKIPSFSLV